MLILLRDTDLNGQPIIGSGLLIPEETALAIIQKMQATSPFNDSDLDGHMRHVLYARATRNLAQRCGTGGASLSRMPRRAWAGRVREGGVETPSQERGTCHVRTSRTDPRQETAKRS